MDPRQSSLVRYYLSRKRSVLIALIGCGVFITFIRWLEERQDRKRAEKRASIDAALHQHQDRRHPSHVISSKRVGVDAKFLKQLKELLPIVIPGR